MFHRKRFKSTAQNVSGKPEQSALSTTRRPKYRLLLLLASLLVLAAAGWWLKTTIDAAVSNNSEAAVAFEPADYVGSDACANCHAEAWNAWQDSQHAKAMQYAADSTVLGDFDNAVFRYDGIESTFFRRNGGYFVRTDGPDGSLNEYRIQHTFGVAPLQQYLIPLPGGRLQALSIAWDSRPKEKGGQRWFHLYPNEKVAHNDTLHWTRPSQNWNRMCADCHSTDLEKHYDPAKRSYATTWSEINVGCEACHGPASRHIAWATQADGSEQYARNHGLAIKLDERSGISWEADPRTNKPARSGARTSEREISMCAHCHARRSQIAEGYVPGQPLLDYYLPSALNESLYFADGQIKDEVYVYASFLQSKMYAAGVTCSDCHDAHSTQLKASGNAVCLQCHAQDRYDRPAHHHHAPGSAGASCVECHMPTRTYMVIDPRRDHSLRIPRPDQSVRLGTPNACNDCHRDKDAAWAAAHTADWYGRTVSRFQNYADAIHAARQGAPEAGDALTELIRDVRVANINRASALDALSQYLDASRVEVLQSALADADPRIRAASVGALERAPLEWQVRLAFPMLQDPVRAVRIAAAQLLGSVPAGDLTPAQRTVFNTAMEEYRAAQLINADWPAAQINLGNFYAAQGKVDEAVEAFSMANEINPWFVPGYVNLADLYRGLGKDNQAEQVLRQALKQLPDQAVLHHVMGLTLVRQQQLGAALEALHEAAGLEPDNAQYLYVYAVALHSSGEVARSIQVLEEALSRFPYNRNILAALVAFHGDKGDDVEAQRYAEKLRGLADH